jgi:hypothetical protein
MRSGSKTPCGRSGATAILFGLVLAALAALGGCSVLVDPDLDELGPPPEACRPGQQRMCTCTGGVQVAQRCNASGAFEPCACPGGLQPAGSGGSAGHSGGGAGARGGTGGAGGRGGAGAAGSAGAAGRTNRGRG